MSGWWVSLKRLFVNLRAGQAPAVTGRDERPLLRVRSVDSLPNDAACSVQHGDIAALATGAVRSGQVLGLSLAAGRLVAHPSLLLNPHQEMLVHGCGLLVVLQAVLMPLISKCGMGAAAGQKLFAPRANLRNPTNRRPVWAI
jgi:hypothetical protein